MTVLLLARTWEAVLSAGVITSVYSQQTGLARRIISIRLDCAVAPAEAVQEAEPDKRKEGTIFFFFKFQ